jgi:hypothetical protein
MQQKRTTESKTAPTKNTASGIRMEQMKERRRQYEVYQKYEAYQKKAGCE